MPSRIASTAPVPPPSRAAVFGGHAGAARWLLPLASVPVVIVCFWPVLWNGFVNFDDPPLLISNPYYQGFGSANLRWMFTTFIKGHWEPLTWLSYAVDYGLWAYFPHIMMAISDHRGKIRIAL